MTGQLKKREKQDSPPRGGRQTRVYNGIVCIDKPGDHTSFDVIARVRGILQTRKAGHGGTLDPMATGVLPVFLGHATRCCDILPDQRKRYIAAARLGEATDTLDCTGRVTATTAARASRARLEAAIASFGDGYDQLPPMYSAIQVGGQRLYDLARQGVEVERERRHVELYSVELLEFDEAAGTFVLDVTCGKGTYVRTFCADVAERAGTLCTLTSLRRTLSGGFALEDCVTLEELTRLAQEGREREALLPVERVFAGLPRVRLAPAQTRLLKNGVKIDLARVRTEAREGPVAVFDSAEGFVAVARADGQSGTLADVKLFCDR